MFFNELRRQALDTHEPMHRAFVKWYVRTRFGSDVKCEITDGPSDGGIDAIVTESRLRGKAIYVIQSKFYDAFSSGRNTPLSIACYQQFDAMPTVFRDDDRVEEWLGTVAIDLKPKYRELRHRLSGHDTTLSWQLITLHARSRAGEDRLQELAADSCIYGAQHLQLFLMSREGATPPADPLTLRFTKSMIVDDRARGVTSYVFAAYLKDFVDFMDHDTEDRLFARNVRLDLKSKINREIRRTYVEAPHEFWYSHNGITVVCTRASVEGERVRLVNPSVINGSQTLHSVKGVPKRDPDAQVLTRVLVVQPDDATHPTRKFVNDVIFRMNQQNPMKASNLRANDDVQVTIAATFAAHKVFYERREGEWSARKRLLRNQGFRRLRSRDLAQILTACDARYGPARAKGRIDALFDEPIYGHLFYQEFSEIALKWLLYEYTIDVIWDTRIRGTKPKQRRQALWALLHIVYQCVRRSPLHRQLLTDPAAARSLRGGTEATSRLRELLSGALRDWWNAWAKANRKERQLDPNNFFKTEGRAQELTARLIEKYEHRGKRAVQDLLAAAR